VFGSDGLFTESAWDILLTLFIAYDEDKVIALDGVIATAPRTGARWVTALMQADLARSWQKDEDGPVLASITPKGFELMLTYLERV